MSELPLLRVRTSHSEYLIDQNKGRYSRRTVHEYANPIPGHSDGEWHEYSEIACGPEAGQPLLIVHPDQSYIRSTLVASVTEVDKDEPWAA